MKINNSLYLPIIVSFIFLTSSQNTHQEKPNTNAGTVIICGTIEGGSKMDTVTLSFKKEFIYNNIGTQNLTVACGDQGAFCFRLPVSHVAMATLFLNTTKPFMVYRYIEPGDSIYCLVKRSGNNFWVKYSGPGAQKLNCMDALDNKRKELNTRLISKKPFTLVSQDPAINRLANFIQRSDEDAIELLAVLESYRNKISHQMKEVLKADILGESGRAKCSLVFYALQTADPKQREEIKRLFFSRVYCKNSSLSRFAAYSENYIEFLYRRCQRQIELQGLSGKYSMQELYSLLAKEYRGLIRDRVITSYLLRGHTGVANKELEWCLRKAVTILVTPIYRDCLENQLNRISTGVPAYDFSLPGPDGKLVSLHSLRGKVVLMDFWFTGCSACKDLAASLEHDVVKLYTDSPVAFVSICLDKDKDKWLKSLEKGGYSTNSSLNLFTQGMAFNHPIAGYYKISGCPFLLIIDKEGNIFSARPPRDPQELCNELNKALRK